VCIVPCPSLTGPENGVITCLLGDDGVPSYNDFCSFICNAGYEKIGSDIRTCQADGSWSGSNTFCVRCEYVRAHMCVCVRMCVGGCV